MRSKIKSLIAILGFLALGISIAVLSKNVSPFQASEVEELVSTGGQPNSARVDLGLGIRIDSTRIEFTVPHCDPTPWQDNVFVHIYIDDKARKLPENFVNMDFNIASALGKIAKDKDSPHCSIIKSFRDFKVTAVSLGQFNAPEGKCCTIIWSRFYKVK